MKIPETIRLNGVDYRVIWKDDLHDDTHMLMGEIVYGESAIYLNPKVQDHQHACLTLWHEILHGIVEHFNISGAENRMPKTEEETVEMFARGVYQVLQDNGRALFDITDPEEQKEEETKHGESEASQS